METFDETPQALLARRLAEFERFRFERLPVLHEFCEALGFEEPHEVLNTPKKFLARLDSGFRDAVISEENRAWFITRIGYHIGECLVVGYHGYWLVDEDPASPAFARYVVGGFAFEGVEAPTVDPFSVAQRYADMPAPRFLAEEINKLAAL
ncbi:hypothetical protein [Pseudomonas tolaasii]|uniref:hypothetical protein n=1 Tax=Pseudomonas tolaasii TaxID=29442 RepID=UPI00030C1347|nr:hypothetical protein [Pseudomonas tolaasii]